MKLPILALIFSLLPATLAAQQITVLPEGAAIILVEGQSNACGQVAISYNVLSTNQQTWLLHHGGTVLRPTFDPVCSHRGTYGGERYPVLLSSPVGIGPVVFAQNRYQELAGGPVASLTYAVGSTTYGRRLPNPSTSSIYGAGMALLSAQLSEAGFVAGAISVGGETDAKSLSNAGQVAANLEAIITGWRGDLGDATLPVVIVTLGDNPHKSSHSHWNLVRDQQLSIDLDNVAFVDPAGLAKQPDGLHYTRASYRSIGEQAAAALFAMQGDTPPPDPDPVPDDLEAIRRLAEEIIRLTE